MNFPLSSTPATPTKKDRELVEQENAYLLGIGMPTFSMENEHDIAEAAAIIRRDNEQFVKVSIHWPGK